MNILSISQQNRPCQQATKRVALYTRVSSQEQATEGISLDAQIAALRGYAKVKDWQVSGEYQDAGFSGGTDQRPNFQMLLVDARHHQFDIVAVAKLDRFFRNLRHLLNYLHELEASGITFISVQESLDTSTPTGKFTLQLLGTVAEFERERIGERVADARRHLASLGQWSSGKPPFGYRFNKTAKVLEVYEPEAEAIRFAFDTYVSREIGIVRLAEAMNAESHVLPETARRKQHIWNQSLLLHILRHPAYKGGPNERWQFKTPAIISSEVWEQAQKKLASNKHFKPANKSNVGLKGKLRCAICGHTLRIGYSHSTKPVYECPGRLKRLHLDNTPRCTLPRFDASLVDRKIAEQLANIFDNPQALANHIKATIDNLESEKQSLSERLRPIETEAAGVKEDMAILDARLEMKRIAPEVYKERMGKLQRKLTELEHRTKEVDPLALEDLKSNEDLVDSYKWLQEILSDSKRVSDIFCFLNNFQGWQERPDLENYRQLSKAALRNALWEQYQGIKDSMVGIVYPDRVELKSRVLIGKSDISPGCKLDRCLESQ